jgi:hypothetical protein
MLEAAHGYAVFNRKGKRIGAFIELAGDHRIMIRHDGVFVWHARQLPLTAVAHVLPDHRAVVLTLDDLTLADTESPPTPAPATSGIAEESPLPSGSWRERVDRYVAAVEGDADEPDRSADGAEHELSPPAEDMRHPVAREADQPPEPSRKDHGAADRHLLFISTPDGYSLVEREGPPPPLGDRIVIPEQAISFLVMKLGASPLPDDHRICAYLEPTA